MRFNCGTINVQIMNQWSLKSRVVILLQRLLVTRGPLPEQLDGVMINKSISGNQEWTGGGKKEGDSRYISQR